MHSVKEDAAIANHRFDFMNTNTISVIVTNYYGSFRTR